MTKTLRFRATIGLLLAAATPASLFLASPVAAQSALPPAVGKPLQTAQSAAKAGNIAAAQKAVDQARAAASTPAERKAVAQMAAYVYTRGGNFGKAAAELESIGAPPSQLAPLYYQARQYDKAIAAAQKSGQLTIVAQSYLQQGKAAEAARIYEKMVAQNPNNLNALQNLAGAQYKMGDKKAYLATTQKLLRLDPTPERWRILLVDMKNEPMSREAKLGLYHLMHQTGALRTQAEVEEFAKIAIVSGQAGFAERVVKEAIASGIFPAGSPMAARIMQAGAQRAADALKSAPTDAKSPKTAMSAGSAYLGVSRYPDAIAAFTLAQKGPTPEAATLFRGIATVKNGNRAGARPIFEGLRTGSMTDIASLWALYSSVGG
jgi:tetratricopeptide (TPR) repeat protein